MSGADSPSVTTRVTATGCASCGRPLTGGRADRLYCSSACRQRAHRMRLGRGPLSEAPGRSARAETVYECPGCEARYLGEQRCEDCGVFCRRVGPGGPCPHCDEPVALADLMHIP